MEHAERPSRSLLVVTSTEWRNLCARGSIRVAATRVQSASERPTRAELWRAFTSAPVTKPGSSVDTFVLEVRPDLPAVARRHPFNNDVLVLELRDVVSHHVAANQDLPYYEPQAEAAGVELSAAIYESDWRTWMLAEQAEACLEAAYVLMHTFGVDDPMPSGHWRPVVQAIGSRDVEIPGLEPRLRQLIRAAPKIDDVAANVRGTQAYWLAVAFEWVEEATGLYPRDVEGRSASAFAWGLASGRQLGWMLPLIHEVEAGLRETQERHPDGFGSGITAHSAGMVVRLLAEARHTTPKADMVMHTINTLASRSASEGALACVVAASTIGPELVRQLAVQLQSTAKGPDTEVM